ncbi:MAG: DUF4783 domain-containing protein [Bacteroidetes bacterium]|nr:DUF4783 domain-containing protein [Bacteroidota bacterium]
MKSFYLLLLLIPAVLASAASDDIDKIADLIKQGNIHELAKSFSATVDLTIMGEENSYPAARAEQLLDDFFKKNRPQSVSILHRITSSASYHYGVLILNTTGEKYRVAFNLRSVKGRFELTELRIEPEKAK